MKEKNLYHNAEFLNSPGYEEDASIFTSISHDTYKHKGIEKDSYWCSLKIRDCDRTITLSIEIGTQEQYKNSIYKVEKIVTHLQKFKEALKKTYEGQKTTPEKKGVPGNKNIGTNPL